MTIPKPSQTKQPILNYLSKAGKPVKISHITESMGKHFNLTEKEMKETSLKGSRRLAMSINAATKEMKAADLVKSSGYGYLKVTSKGSGFDGLKATVTNGRKRRKPGRPPKAKVKSANGRRKPSRPKIQVKAKNGRKKPSRPKIQPAITPIKQDDKMIQRTTDIVVSYFGKNSVDVKQIPGMIQSIYAALQGLGTSNKPVVKRKYTRKIMSDKKKSSSKIHPRPITWSKKGAKSPKRKTVTKKKK